MGNTVEQVSEQNEKKNEVEGNEKIYGENRLGNNQNNRSINRFVVKIADTDNKCGGWSIFLFGFLAITSQHLSLAHFRSHFSSHLFHSLVTSLLVSFFVCLSLFSMLDLVRRTREL